MGECVPYGRLAVSFGKAVLNVDILSLNKSRFVQALTKCAKEMRGTGN